MFPSESSHLSLRYPQVKEEGKSPRQRASSPAACDQSRRLSQQQDYSSGPHLESSSARSVVSFLTMACWLKVKAEMTKLLYAKLLVLVTWLLASLVIFPLMSTSIRNSRALNGIVRAGKVVFSVVKDPPVLVAAGIGLICGWIILGLLRAGGSLH